MGIYEELQARGLIAQVTDEPLIRDLVNNGKATFYIGFDPTADSLHVGHFMALCLMKRLQEAGNKPIALIGGGTAMIGDPSGRTDMRQMMTPETIQHNCDCFKKQMSRFIDFSDGKALMVNNADWLMDLNYVEVLREVGAHFSVNRMLTAECYKQRMEKGLSFLEFNYMIMQSYDIYMLYQKYGCNLQFGGDVSVEQFNFAGIGTTGGGVPGYSYPDVRTGVRAQIQHLKAYATDEPLNQTCVDNRYEYVKKASAPYVQWLGQKENPEGAGWATGENYGYDIAGMLQHLLLKEQG